MKILYIAWTDIGNVNRWRAEAINRCTASEAKCISVKGHCDFGENPKTAEDMAKKIGEVVRGCHLVHQSNTHPWIFGLDKGNNYVCEFNGGYMRMYSKILWEWQTKTQKPLICPPILGRFALHSHYIPVPLDTDRIVPADDWLEEHSPVRVIQTATRRDYKDTDALIEACRGLDNVSLKVVEKVSQEEAIRVKRNSDIYFGSFKFGGLGMSHREGMAFGLALVNRMQPIERVYNPHYPGVEASNTQELRQAIKELANDPDYLRRKKQECREWSVHRYAYDVIGPMQEDFYKYVIYDDDPYWWHETSKIWMEVAKKEHSIDSFVNPQKLRW